MIPHYETCIDNKCPHWRDDIVDCKLLPDECPFAVIHLAQDRTNQQVKNRWRGPFVSYWEDGIAIRHKLSYALNEAGETAINGDAKYYSRNGKIEKEGFIAMNERSGMWHFYDDSGDLIARNYYEFDVVVERWTHPKLNNPT